MLPPPPPGVQQCVDPLADLMGEGEFPTPTSAPSVGVPPRTPTPRVVLPRL